MVAEPYRTGPFLYPCALLDRRNQCIITGLEGFLICKEHVTLFILGTDLIDGRKKTVTVLKINLPHTIFFKVRKKYTPQFFQNDVGRMAYRIAGHVTVYLYSGKFMFDNLC